MTNKDLAVLATYAVLIMIIVCSCGMAFRATGRDNECAKQGGHLEGLFEMRCVIP